MQQTIDFVDKSPVVPEQLLALWKKENPYVLNQPMFDISVEKLQSEQQILDAVAECLKTHPKDKNTETVSKPEKKWLLVSGMQKAIRRGNDLKARQCAHAVRGLDSDYLWRRLCVIALEDIGWANPIACAMTLAVAAKKTFRKEHGEKDVLFFIVDMLALGMKDRTLCDWVNERHGQPEKLKFNKEMFDHSMVNSEMPFVGKFMAVKGRMLMRDPLFLAVLPQWKMLLKSDNFNAIEWPVQEDEIHGIPASAYDQHTMVGKRALAYFSKSCNEVRKILADYPFLDVVAVLGGIVFVFEGALLNRQFVFQGWKEIFDAGLDSDYHFMKGMPAEKKLELVDAVRQNLATLNKARARVSE